MFMTKAPLILSALLLGACDTFAGTYTGNITVSTLISGETNSVETSASIPDVSATDVGPGVSLESFPASFCPNLLGTVNGRVATVSNTLCWPQGGAADGGSTSLVITGGTLTLDGNSLVVNVTGAVTADNGTGTTTITGTLTR